jgi:hypothetical protein
LVDAPGPVKSRCSAPSQRGVSRGLTVDVFDVEASTPGLRCCAFLRRTRASEDSRIAFFQSGTGVYTTADGDLDGLAKSAAQSGRMAVLSIDKPGIGSSSQGWATVDREAFERHTLADLVACSRHAIDSAFARTGIAKNATVVAHGHSEGAQVWARVLAEAATREEDAAWFGRVEASLLSGLPLEPVVTGAERQLGVFLPFEVEAFHRAVLARDDDYLMLLGMPWRYLAHPTARESTTKVLDRLATARPGLRIELFHGESDRNAPFAPVRELVQRNRRAKLEQRPSLDLRLHGYPGAFHQLDERLDADIDALVAALPPR